MPKKKKTSEYLEIFQVVGNFIKTFLTKTVDNVVDQFKDGMDKAVRKGVQTLTGFLIVIAGLVFLLVGLSQAVGELLDLGQGVGYIAVGVVTTLFGVLIVEKIKGEK